MSMEDPFADNTTPDSGTSFFEGGAPSCKFANIGDLHTGIVLKYDERQQRDIQTGEPKSWPDGKPCMMLAVTLQTEEHDNDIDGDDGVRMLYINKPGGMFSAVSKAIRDSKGRFAPGGTLAVKYIKNGVAKQKGFNAPKEYAAKYTPPGAAKPEKVSTSASDLDLVKKEAWLALKAKYPTANGDAELVKVLDGHINEFYPGQKRTTLGVKQWRELIDMGFDADRLAMAGAPVSDDDIPF